MAVMSAKTVLLFSLLVFVGTVYTSCGECGKKIACPGYNGAVLKDWFPYNDNQELVFMNDQNETDTFHLKNTATTAPYEFISSYGRPARCHAENVFMSTETDSSGYSRLRVSLNEEENFKTARLALSRQYINIYELEENKYARVEIGPKPAVSQHLQRASIGNRIFTNVYEAKTDTTGDKSSGIYRVFIRKGEGLVAYSEYPSLTTWVKQ